jgi:hypothetical protein
MSIDQLRLINRCLGVVLIAAYLALGYFVVSGLLQGTTTTQSTGSDPR